MRVVVRMEADGVRASLAALRDVMSTHRQELHENMAGGVETLVRKHLLERDGAKSPNTGFYGKAARSVESSATDERGEVRIPHRGMALRYYGSGGLPGGVVRPTEMKNLALPTANVPVRGGERMRPGEFEDLAWLPAKKTARPNVTGYLVEGIRLDKQNERRIAPKPDGKLMFVLMAETKHNPDATVLPAEEEMHGAARMAAEDFLEAYTDQLT